MRLERKVPAKLGKDIQISQTSVLLGVQSVQFSLVAQSCPNLFDPMDCNTPGFPVHHQLPEFAQIHVHQISDAIQPSMYNGTLFYVQWCPLF